MALGVINMIQFDEACRPVIFENDLADFPYWVKGSSFLLANSHNYYWVTASHVLENMRGAAGSLRIFPSDNSKISLPFNEQYTIKKELSGDEDYKDIYILRVDLTEFDQFGDAPLVAQDIEQGILPAEQLQIDDELWVIGYPAESNFIEYEESKIKNTRSVLRALYKGTSICDHCHKLIVESSIKLEDYDGLSGGPVYFIKKAEAGQIAIPLLVGMLLRGTASSQIAHFVSSSVILEILNLVESNA